MQVCESEPHQGGCGGQIGECAVEIQRTSDFGLPAQHIPRVRAHARLVTHESMCDCVCSLSKVLEVFGPVPSVACNVANTSF
jgi:hypothetical protein